MKRVVRTPLDIPIFLLLLSGFIGYWTSYDRSASLPKLAMLIGAVLVYYILIALCRVPRLFQLALWAFMLGGAGASIYFIAQTNFAVSPTKIEILTNLGSALNALLPRLVTHSPHPNLAAGAFEFVLPFAVIGFLHYGKQRTWLAAAGAATCALVILLGLLLTTSRGAWLAIVFVSTAVLLVSTLFAWLQHMPAPRRQQFLREGVGLAILLLLTVLLILVTQREPISNALHSNRAIASRLELYQQTWELIQEYPLTGAGLSVFPIVYSVYALLIDAPLLPHAHNLFLAIWIEQGILGIGALVWLLVAFGVWGWRNRDSLTWISLAGFVAISIWLVHGLVDVPMYGSHAFPFLLAPFAFALRSVSLHVPAQNAKVVSAKHIPFLTWYIRVAALLFIGAMVLLVVLTKSLSIAYSNLGAVIQTQAELSRYRADKPPIEIHSLMEIRRTLTTQLDVPIQFYTTALRYDSTNQVARRRLGMIALARRDFDGAVLHLSAAYQINPDARATRKALGYAYAWNGQIEQAQALLNPFPETRLELWDDTWWWKLQGRPDLANDAEKLLRRLATIDVGECSGECR